MNYWNIKFFDNHEEFETVRGLTEIQKDALESMAERENIRYTTHKVEKGENQ